MPKRKRSTGTGPTSGSNAPIADQSTHKDVPENESSIEPSQASKHKVAKKKRKRGKKNEANRKGGDASTSAKHARVSGKKCILNGLTLAVTTLDKKREDASAGTDAQQQQQLSWKNTIDKCKQYGANITSQVHKRVHALIVSDAAVRNATQRVRKAIKLGVPIVDVGWVEACIKDGSRCDWTEYLRNDEAKEAAESKKKAGSAGGEGCGVKFDISADDANATSGWSEPVELDCCCVCHENGDLECPWCTGETECNLTKRRLGKEE